MANNLGLTEVTLAELVDSSLEHNTRAGTRAYNQKFVVRVTDHVSNDASEEDDGEKMAIFEQSQKGMPWERRGTKLNRTIYHHDGVSTPDDDAEVYYPDFDYTEFE